jgi:hypothetical protein
VKEGGKGSKQKGEKREGRKDVKEGVRESKEKCEKRVVGVVTDTGFYKVDKYKARPASFRPASFKEDDDASLQPPPLNPGPRRLGLDEDAPPKKPRILMWPTINKPAYMPKRKDVSGC